MTFAPSHNTVFRFAPADRLRDLAPYEPPKASPFVDLALDANEGAAVDDTMLEALCAITAEDLRRYPNAAALERRIAAVWEVSPESVVVTNGADDAIDRLCRVALEPGREALVHTPTFEMIERGARLAGGDVRRVPWLNGPFPVEAFLKGVSDQTAMVSLVTPNNPTGGVVPAADVQAVVRAARGVGALVLIDLAYVEFADEDPTESLLGEPNVVITRTFSKARGLAGARVGYAVASPEVARGLRTVGQPFPVSSASLALAGVSLDGEADVVRSVASVREQRDRLGDELRALNCEVFASQANFLLTRCPNASFVRDALRSLGIAVRTFPSRPELDGCLRITAPADSDEGDRLRSALRTVLAPKAILFDLDGVLADVSRSYRAAIIETARSFGVVVSADDIAAVKRAGDANNDWEVAHMAIERRGVTCALDDVIARFQTAYLGTPEHAGLRETERLIPHAGLLRRLGTRYRFAVVTGRPRSEAEWFLDRAGVRALFPVLVGMEDGPAKPSPQPVRAALERTGVEGAWMIGDTPDDIVAARRAGVVPIGVPAPGGDRGPDGQAMFGAGAAAVIDTLDALEEMLP